MLIVQVLLGDSTVGMAQVGVAANSAAFGPLTARELTLRASSPVSVKVISRELLDLSNGSTAKVLRRRKEGRDRSTERLNRRARYRDHSFPTCSVCEWRTRNFREPPDCESIRKA